MEMGHLFEAVMLVCFGFSWPLNVMKAYKARTAKGTSLMFILLIITGYLAGITAKFMNHQINYVLVVYFINLAIVMMNVLVYVRNKTLDKKRKEEKIMQVTASDINNTNKEEKGKMNYTYSFDELINRNGGNTQERKNEVILFGGALETKIPVQSLAKEFDFNFKLYNKSVDGLSIAKANEVFIKNIAALKPEGIMIHVGEKDVDLFKKDSSEFDRYYFDLISNVRACNKNCRIALVSVRNPENNSTICDMNKNIKAIADAEKCTFVNLENVGLWNPEATKASIKFAYSMGLKTRKPLSDVAEILYSYANLQIVENEAGNVLVG